MYHITAGLVGKSSPSSSHMYLPPAPLGGTPTSIPIKSKEELEVATKRAGGTRAARTGGSAAMS